MTTEIAVLNRLGVALAADSAVTISGGGTTKVFDSADKLFELSCHFPVALMLNGNMDCFGVPWEIIIKDFRELRGETENRSILKWAEEFVRFVEDRSDVGEDAAQNYVRHVSEDEILSLRREVSNRLWASPSSLRSGVEKAVPPIMAAAIEDRRKELSEVPVAMSLSSFSDDEIISEYSGLLKDIIAKQLEPFSVPEDIEKNICLMIADALRAIIPNDFSTGLIVAGYGNGDNYPSVASVDIEGYVKGRLKYSQINDKAKIVRPEFGHAVSFAQTDVIDRLLSGADPRFIKKTADFFSRAAEQLAPLIVDAYAPKATKRRRKAQEDKIKKILDLVRDEYINDTANSLQVEFREEFERMIALMPKLELIELAEALISITAIERKATADEGTVGGPIDVAFITKHEGFVWIKRKHYFQPSLNPRYFWRKYHSLDRGAET